VAWPTVLPLYLSSVAWTVVYDTLYAHQDKRDDARLGLRSTALTLGEQTKPALAAFSAVMVGGLLLAGGEAGLAWPFYVGTGLTASHLAWQIATADLGDPKSLAERFESNKWVGGLVFASIVGGRLVG
jgi:4-hydroxybenzoate polyprenyltransferase